MHQVSDLVLGHSLSRMVASQYLPAYTHIYIYIYIERERERERESLVHPYIYIYIYGCTQVEIERMFFAWRGRHWRGATFLLILLLLLFSARGELAASNLFRLGERWKFAHLPLIFGGANSQKFLIY